MNLSRKNYRNVVICMTLALLTITVSCADQPKFQWKQDLPSGQFFNQKDVLRVDLADYVKGGFDVTVDDSDFKENIDITLPLDSLDDESQARQLVDRNCREMKHINKTRNFI